MLLYVDLLVNFGHGLSHKADSLLLFYLLAVPFLEITDLLWISLFKSVKWRSGNSLSFSAEREDLI